MSKLIRLLCQIYLLLVLLVATTLSSLPYLPLALILLLVTLLIAFRPLPSRLNLVIIIAIFLLLPQILASLSGYLTDLARLPLLVRYWLVIAPTLPLIYLLDYYLKQNAPNMTIVFHQKGRHTTSVLNALFIATLTLLLVSLPINNPVLLLTTAALAVYLLVILIKVLRTVPGSPFEITKLTKRVIAGTTTEVNLYATSKASAGIHSQLSPVEPWVSSIPQRFRLDGASTELSLTLTPPLAGAHIPKLQVAGIDLRGFIQVNQIIEPLELHVIPRARYAEWLALRYLEHTGARGEAGTTQLPKAIARPKRGVEYFDSRDYQPGDPLKDVDWKHTVKLNQLIIKEFIEAGGQTAIIAVNLSVADAEEADRVAFNLITTALTLAIEAIPTAITIYDYQQVLLTTPVLDPREILKQTLRTVKDITAVKLVHRFLQPPDISTLKRNIALLKPGTSPPVQRLRDMLQFEYAAIAEAAKNQPATIALSRVTEHVAPPAIIALISRMNHDAEAVTVTTEKLARRGFTTMLIQEGKLKLRSSYRNLSPNISGTGL